MKVELKTEKSIRGVLEPAGAVVDVSDGVAEWLIERGDAAKVTKTKKASE